MWGGLMASLKWRRQCKGSWGHPGIISCLSLFALTSSFAFAGNSSDAVSPKSLTIFVDGAGNWGHGAADLRKGFKAAGFESKVEEFRWSQTFNPLFDQMNGRAARRRARFLAERIREIRRGDPHVQINIVAFSAGTGVAVWACESLDEHSRVDNLVLLGSSLSHDYDLGLAAVNVNQQVLAFHSKKDAVLQVVPSICTIDGMRGVNAAGLVGFSKQSSVGCQVTNQSWRPEWKSLGWSGGHKDCTAPNFIRSVLVGHLQSSPVSVMKAEMRESQVSSGRYRL